MKLRELLNLIQQTAVDNGIPQPMITGGVPRDKLTGVLKTEIADVDITNGHSSIHNLAQEVSIELKKNYDITIKKMDDGHSSVIFPGDKFKLDFSSHFLIPRIDLYLHQLGIQDPTDMQREAFSRDFYCNTLLLTLDLKKIKDPTHQGIKDIKNKIIRTCLDPNTTFRHNTNRIIRVIYLSAKLDFDVAPEIISWISEHKDMVRLSSDHYLTKNLDKAMAKNQERAVWLINKMGLWDVIPITSALQPYAKQTPPTKTAQLKRNFDYGSGLFSQLDKYHSVADFRKKRRNKRKKILKQIRDMKLKWKP
jgi:tRNA nucleotidyltransferase/poly(A) polymerase